MKTSNNNDLNSAKEIFSVWRLSDLSSCVKATALPVCCDRLRRAGGGPNESVNKSFEQIIFLRWSQIPVIQHAERDLFFPSPFPCISSPVKAFIVSTSPSAAFLNVAGCLLRRNNTRHDPLGRNAPCCYWLLYSCCFAPEVTRQRSHGIENLT